MRRSTTRIAAIAAVVAVTSALAGCIGQPEPMPVPTTSGSPSSSPSPSPSPTRIPVIHLDGSAAANHQFFDYLNQAYWDAYGKGTGQDIVTNLANNGFSKLAMEVTYDTTAIDIPADSIVVSVQVQGECLIGQFGPTKYTSVLAPLLGTGKCLVGVTRPIDW
ncbi:DUF6993 domain-containing protein [Schumannella luteola]|jgi:hypothetical protein